MQLLPFFEDRFEDNGKSKTNYQHMRKTASEFISKVQKFGDEVFEHCSRHADKTQRIVDRVLLALARHNASQLDCINILLASGGVDGCSSLLRSILDATFGIAHIVQDKHQERALSYQLVRMKRFIKHLRRGDRTHPDGRQLETELATDAFVPDALSKLPPGLADKADKFERELNAKLEFVPILAEWERLKHFGGKTQKDPEWYTLFGGARDIRRLAKQLGWQSLYDFFYRDWSNTAHAGNALENYTTADNCLRPLRYPAGYASALSLAIPFYLNGLERLASFYDATLAGQVRTHGVAVLYPELVRIAGQIGTALQAFR